MMMLQIMIVKNGLMRMNDQYPRSPRQTIRTTRTTSSSLDTPNLGDRSSSFTAAVLYEGPLLVSRVPFHKPHLGFARSRPSAIRSRRHKVGLSVPASPEAM